ncbi:MAG: hypothetical protein E7571_00685 [Ruminococcaceae bacterium]|nr:hypothetical protein [Oscillospiraceae bacterium]
MKKLLPLVILLCVCLALPLNAFAATDCTDDEFNVTFTIPDGWSRDTGLENSTIKYFFFDESGNNAIAYIVADEYANQDEETKKKFDRSELDNSAETIEDFEKTIKTVVPSASNVKTSEKEVGDYSYYKATLDYYDEASGLNINMMAYEHLYNGYSFFFAMYGYNGTACDENVMEEILETVNFKDETGSNKTQTKAQATAKNVGKSFGKGAVKGLIYVLVFGGFSGIAAAIKKRKSKKSQQVQNTENAYYQPNNNYQQNGNYYQPNQQNNVQPTYTPVSDIPPAYPQHPNGQYNQDVQSGYSQNNQYGDNGYGNPQTDNQNGYYDQTQSPFNQNK